MLVLRIAAAVGDILPLRRVVQIGKAGVVELQILASQLAERLDFVRIHARQRSPEIVHVRIHRRIHDRRATTIVHHARRRDGQLGRLAGDGLQKREVVAEDAVVQVQRARDAQRRRIELDVALVVVELDIESILRPRYTAHLVQEIHVPGAAAKFTVGDSFQPDVLLQAHDLANGRILCLAQLFRRDSAAAACLARLLQSLRTQQTADVIGAERGFRSLHGRWRRHTGLPCERFITATVQPTANIGIGA